MAIRIRSHWWNEDTERSLPEIANALAAIAWRVALDKAITLHCERFIYESDAQRLQVIQEYLAFLVQVADRHAHRMFDDAERRALILGMVRHLCVHLQDNSSDLLGSGDHVAPFLALLDTRSDEYAGHRFDDEGPSYALLRHLGFAIQARMGEAPENRWVIDQVMDRDGWEAYRLLSGALRDLLA